MATMRARIELRGALTHEGRGRKSVRGKPFYSTNASEIAYYRSCGEFIVTVLSTDEAVRPKPKKTKKGKKAKAPPPPEEDDDEDDEEDDEEDEDERGEVTDTLTKSALMAQNKTSLATLAFDMFKLELDVDALSKSKMVGAILKAQIEALESAGDE